MTWLMSWGTSEDDIEKLTTQFLLTLRANLARVTPPQSPGRLEQYKLVVQLLDPSRKITWNDCYEAEQLLVDLFDDETLRSEIDTRKLEARNLRPALAEYYLKTIEAADKPERQRAVLARLINDLQWRYTINQGKRQFSKSLTWRTGVISVAVLAFYAALIAAVRWSGWQLTYGDLSLFFIASISGAWGATFSMLTTIQGRIDASEIYDLNVMRSYVMIASRVLIGVVAASILYFFLVSGLLGGTAFPSLSAPAAANEPTVSRAAECLAGTLHCLAIKDFALLVVWCILAGFSEQLVPGLLAKTEKRTDDTPPERIRPNDAAQGKTTDSGQAAAAGEKTGGAGAEVEPPAA